MTTSCCQGYVPRKGRERGTGEMGVLAVTLALVALVAAATASVATASVV